MKPMFGSDAANKPDVTIERQGWPSIRSLTTLGTTAPDPANQQRWQTDNRSGYQLIESNDEVLLYDGTWQSFPVQFSYGFNSGELTGGYIDVLELSEASWHSVGNYLAGKYPLSTTEPCQNTDRLCQIICAGDAKIVHLLSDDREVHVVRYYERTPQHPCGRDQSFVEEASANSNQ